VSHPHVSESGDSPTATWVSGGLGRPLASVSRVSIVSSPIISGMGLTLGATTDSHRRSTGP